MKPRVIILRQLLLLTVDAAMVGSAFLLAYTIRFYADLIPLCHAVPPLAWYTQPLWIVVLVYLLFFRSAGLYSNRRMFKPLEELGAVVHGTTLASIVLMALTFFYRDTSYSRMVVLLGWTLSSLLVTIGRFTLRQALAVCLPQWQRKPRLLILGTGPAAVHVVQRLKGQGSHELVGAVQVLGGSPEGVRLEGIPILGQTRDFKQLLATRLVDEAVLAEPELPRTQVMELLTQCEQEMVDFRMVPDLLGLLTTHVGVQNLDGIPLLGLRETPLNDPWNRFLKRAMDITIASLGLLVTAPAWLVIAFSIKRDSPGPVFYLQERVGQDGEIFRMLKFRTMAVGAEDRTGPIWAKPDDERRTRVGRVLRRWNLDELPQLLHVLKGQMSLVGPRPERPHFVHQFKQHIPHYMTRHRIRSGMTGWAQIHGLRGDTSIEERTKYDLYYFENWSLWLDCKILRRSLAAVKNAY